MEVRECDIMNNIKTILLTGATGFIGSHLLRRLIKDRYDVIILKRSTSNTQRIKNIINKTKYYDVDKEDIKKVFEKHDVNCVVHLATYYRKNDEDIDIDELSDSNFKFPMKLLECMRKHQVGYFINTGTFFEYELSNKKIDEQHKISAYNLYAAVKIAFLDILRYYSKEYNIKVIDLKLFSPYGPDDNPKLINYLISSLKNDKAIYLTKGEQKLDWTYVDDIVDAYVKAIRYIKKMRSNFETFNICNGNAVSIRNIVSELITLSNKQVKVYFDKPYNNKEIFFSECDNTKARNILGWNPKYDIRKGLYKTYKE